MKLERRKFALRGPLSLLMFNGRLAFWSREEPPVLIWLSPVEAGLLLQFAAAPREAAEVANVVGVNNSQVDQLVDKLVQHRMLSEQFDACDEPFYALYSPEIKKEETVCLVELDGLGNQSVNDICNGLITSGLVGENPLSEPFTGTRGFGIKFRREALDTVIKLLPWTQRYFEKILDENIARQFCAGRSESSQPNAFYLNALVIPPGKGTGLHIDKTLDGRTTPNLVSVLYLETTPSAEGLLYLTEKNWPVGLVNPRPGMIVHFRGNLAHGVSPTPSSSVVRSSLVCEQYFLGKEQIGSCPQLQLVVR